MSGTYLTRAQAREFDRRAEEEFGVPGIVLMENAGRSTADLVLELKGGGPVAICCGKGNNGGDGFVVARHLDNRGVAVRVLLFTPAESLTGDAAVNFRILQRSGLPLSIQPDQAALTEELAAAAWVIDALFGTGLSGPVRATL